MTEQLNDLVEAASKAISDAAFVVDPVGGLPGGTALLKKLFAEAIGDDLDQWLEITKREMAEENDLGTRH